ncbi:MAG: Prenyltransferase and squalene oxidase repeat protein, partial [Verrucomicrobia bacterium]|nr:Prenyltransferase and squalene oxidase repeat protein [Verrucomicrobiota bacterium]
MGLSSKSKTQSSKEIPSNKRGKVNTENKTDRRALNRRQWLKGVASAGVLLGTSGPRLFAAEATDWKKKIFSYLAQHPRADGGYAWSDQDDSHLTPTFAVIGCYKL